MPIVNCRKCQLKFNDLSSFRKHQWASHPEIFKNLRKAARNPRVMKKAMLARKEAFAKKALAKFSVNSTNSSNSLNGLTALELLNKLKDQQRFLHDVVNLVSGILIQHGSHIK